MYYKGEIMEELTPNKIPRNYPPHTHTIYFMPISQADAWPARFRSTTAAMR